MLFIDREEKQIEIVDQSINMLRNDGIFVLESISREFSNPPFRIREFGDTQLNFWKNES